MLVSLCYFQRLLSLPLLFIYSSVNGKSSIPHFSFVPYFICSCCSLFISCSCRAMPPFIFVLFNLSLPCILTYPVPSARRSCDGELFRNASFLFCHKTKSIYPPSTFSLLHPFDPQPAMLLFFFLGFFALSISAFFIFRDPRRAFVEKYRQRHGRKRNRPEDRFSLLKTAKVGEWGEKRGERNNGLSPRRRGSLFAH